MQIKPLIVVEHERAAESATNKAGRDDRELHRVVGVRRAVQVVLDGLDEHGSG